MKPTDSPAVDHRRDPDLVGAEYALRRAARRARERAAQMGRGVMVWMDGQVVEEYREATNIERVKTSGGGHEP